MRDPISASLSDAHTHELCQRAVPGGCAVLVPHTPLAGKPLMECFSIVDDYIALHGGTAVVGWAIWEVPGVYIEAEFHTVWQAPDGVLHDLTPRPKAFESILFLPDPTRHYTGLQVDNIRQALVDDRDVYRYLHLVTRMFALTNAGDLATQYGEISLPPKAAKEYGKVADELSKLHPRLAKRYH